MPARRRRKSAARFESWLRLVARLSSAPWASKAANDTTAPPFLAGTTLAGGRLAVGALIGSGGMGAVYAAHDRWRGRELALKAQHAGRDDYRTAIENEFETLSAVQHPNIVQVHDLFEEDGRRFFTMERVLGIPFTAFARPDGLDPDRLRRALVQLADALAALHAARKVHGDVKPTNVLVAGDERVVLLDLGLASNADEPGPAPLSGAGTAPYMAPEQARGPRTPAADWYAVGVMLYETLSGTLPHPANAPVLPSRTPRDLARLCLALLERDPARRPGGAAVRGSLSGAG